MHARLLLLTTSAAVGLALTSAAQAGTFSVTPTLIKLDEDHRSVLLTISNQGDTPQRFEVTIAEWDESEQGVMLLAPTQHLVVYPTLLSVQPGTSRNLRVGSAVDGATTEGSYRMLISELPSLNDDGTTGVKVLTRVSVPVFQEPDKATARIKVEAFTVADGLLSITLANDGRAHVMVSQLNAVLRDRSGSELARSEVRGWYVLPGNRRRFDLELPPIDCATIHLVDVTVVSNDGTWWGGGSLTPGSCVP